MGVQRIAVLSCLLALTAAGTAPAQVELPSVPGLDPTPTSTPVPAPTATATPADEPTATPESRGPLPEGDSLRSALRRAWLAGRMSRADYERGLAVSDRVKRARRLPGRRGLEVAAVSGMVEQLAAEGRLGSSRLALALETLRRNVEAWSDGPLPRPGERRLFDGLVFQYVAGRGFHHHPLGSFGRANALAKPCVAAAERRRRARIARVRVRSLAHRVGETFRVRTRARRPGSAPRCRAAALRRTVERLTPLAADRGGFLAWEYLFPFGGAQWPWISAMTEGTAVQALARAAEGLDEPAYAAMADRALGAFETPPPAGVRVDGRYAMYSQAPTLHVLNGFLQSLIGLHDHAELTGSERSAGLFRQAERGAPAAVRAADTGAWSLYSIGGREADLHYHRLVVDFLGGLCDRTGRRAYCAAERRFDSYTRQAPRVRVEWPSGARARSASTISFSLSKVSTVRLRARGTRRTVELPRGRHSLTWTPARKGRRQVRLSATGPEGRTARLMRTFAVKPSFAEIAARRRRQAARREAFARARREAERAHERAVRRAARHGE